MTVTPIRTSRVAAPITAEKALPRDIESENELIGALLLNPEAFSAIAHLNLTAEMFYFSPNRLIYQAIMDIQNAGKAIDLSAVSIYLSDKELLDKAGGKTRLIELIDPVVSAVHIDYCAESIRDKYFRRKGYERAIEASEMFLDTSKPLESVLDASESLIYAVKNESNLGSASEPESVGNLIDSYFQWLESDDEPSLRTGFLDLDGLTGGIFKSDLIIAAGRASMGKTHFGVAQAYNVAKIHNKPVFFLSLEMSKHKILSRFLSLHCEVDSFKLARKALSTEEWAKLAAGVDSFSNMPIEVDDSIDLTVASIRSKVRRLCQKYQMPPALIVLDYIQLMGDESDNRVRELDKIVKGLKGIAKEFQTTVLGLAQINRSVEGRSDKRPTMSDIRESGAIEAHSDQIILLYRNDYYNKDSKDGRIELDVAKNRGGKTDKVTMLFNPEYSQFRDELRRY